MLLNPGDSLKLIALVESAGDDLSVMGRLAGVEQIVQIPPNDWMAHLTFHSEDHLTRELRAMPTGQAMRDAESHEPLDCMRWKWPLLANPNGEAQDLLERIEVKVNGIAAKQPTMFIYGVTNGGRPISARDFGGPICIRSRQSIFRHSHLILKRHSRLEAGEASIPTGVEDHEVRVEALDLGPGRPDWSVMDKGD